MKGRLEKNRVPCHTGIPPCLRASVVNRFLVSKRSKLGMEKMRAEVKNVNC